MTELYIFSWDFDKVYQEAGDEYTSVVIEAHDEEEAWQLLLSHPDYETWEPNYPVWQVKTSRELITGEPRVILLTYGMY